jgi:hypothetical protein
MAQAHLDEVGPVWDNDNCDIYFSQIRLIAEAAQYAVCWWIDCETTGGYDMIANLSYGIYRSHYSVVEDAYTACNARDQADSLTQLNLINFGIHYVCDNVTAEYLSIFPLNDYEYAFIMETV